MDEFVQWSCQGQINVPADNPIWNLAKFPSLIIFSTFRQVAEIVHMPVVKQASLTPRVRH
jgi:hypothetical protein